MTVSQIQFPGLPTYLSSSQSAAIHLAKTRVEAIAAQHIEMVFEQGSERFQVLSDINLEIPAGNIQLLMGPSGSGKTTLLSILAGILTPTSGSVRLLGKQVTGMSRSQLSNFRLKNLGFIFQGFNLFPALTAVDNVELALTMKGVKPRNARVEAIDLLDQVGLADKAKSLPRNLSGGQKQRVAIARALAANPPIIMADEPTAALDSHSGHAVIELLVKLAKEAGRTVLIVTHDPRIVDIADRVLYLEDGILKS